MSLFTDWLEIKTHKQKFIGIIKWVKLFPHFIFLLQENAKVEKIKPKKTNEVNTTPTEIFKNLVLADFIFIIQVLHAYSFGNLNAINGAYGKQDSSKLSGTLTFSGHRESHRSRFIMSLSRNFLYTCNQGYMCCILEFVCCLYTDTHTHNFFPWIEIIVLTMVSFWHFSLNWVFKHIIIHISTSIFSTVAWYPCTCVP